LWMISPYFHMCHGCHGQKSFWSIAQKWGDDDQSMKFGMYMPNICIYIYTRVFPWNGMNDHKLPSSLTPAHIFCYADIATFKTAH
jgi:hypothetical protein